MREARDRPDGGAGPVDAFALVGTVFPNFTHLGATRAIRVWHPRGPGEMEVWTWTFVGADWPEEVKRRAVAASQLSFSTTGIFEIDDSENWSEISAVRNGVVASRVPLNYQMRALPAHDRDPRFPDVDARSSALLSDHGQLNFYRRWAEVMDGPDPVLPDTSWSAS